MLKTVVEINNKKNYGHDHDNIYWESESENKCTINKSTCMWKGK